MKLKIALILALAATLLLGCAEKGQVASQGRDKSEASALSSSVDASLPPVSESQPQAEESEPQAEEPEAALTDGTFSVLSFSGQKLIIRLEKASVVSGLELSSPDGNIAVASVSNLDDSMTMTAEGFRYNPGRLECTFQLPADYKPDKLYITGAKGSEAIEFDISGMEYSP